MQTPKTFLALGAAVCAALLLSACAGSAAKAPSAAASSAPPVSISQPGPASAAPSVSSGTQEQQSFTGEILDVAMNQMWVLLPDGTELSFVYEAADISGLQDGRPGEKVIVYYTGTLDGENTDGITVTRIETDTAA